MAGEYVFTISDLKKSYGAKTILENIHLSFYHGTKIGIVGENGSGKSTLLKIMAGEDKEFDRRLKTAQTLLKEREIKGKENANRPRTPDSAQERRQLPQTEMGSLRSVGEDVL